MGETEFMEFWFEQVSEISLACALLKDFFFLAYMIVLQNLEIFSFILK